MATINLQCNSFNFSNAENSTTSNCIHGRSADTRNEREFEEKPSGFTQPYKKCVMKMKQREKECTHKNVIDGGKHFIKHIQKTGKSDFDKLQVNNSGQYEGTICLANE